MRPGHHSTRYGPAAATRHLRAVLTAWLSAAVHLPAIKPFEIATPHPGEPRAPSYHPQGCTQNHKAEHAQQGPAPRRPLHEWVEQQAEELDGQQRSGWISLEGVDGGHESSVGLGVGAATSDVDR